MRRRLEFQPGFILSLRPYKESSVLLEVFTESEGRVGLVARGARGARSKQRGILQSFVPLLVSWTESGDLGTLTAAEAAGPGIELQGERIFHGWYVNELLTRLLQRHDPHPALYTAYVAALQALVAGDDEPALRRFELQLLAELGYGFDLGGDLQPGDHYRYDFELGLIASLPGSEGAMSGATLLALRDRRLGDCDATQRREARNLLRAAIRRQLGDRELETPQLLRALRARIGNSPRDP